MIFTKNVCAGLITRYDHFLIGKRAVGQDWAGYWEFPGGKCRMGETAQQCLERELFEELRVVARASGVLKRLIRHCPGGSIQFLAMKADIVAGRVEKVVHEELDWVSPQRLLDYKLALADRVLAEWVCEQAARPTAVVSAF